MSFPYQVDSGGFCGDRSGRSLGISEHVHGWVEVMRAENKEDRVLEGGLGRRIVKGIRYDFGWIVNYVIQILADTEVGGLAEALNTFDTKP